ncbi:MAG TPA: hypothetical protein VGO96_21180 [Pyrinomonadaceae bacterium]|nr:hypothetical protein [Pyrinomonadaceae bacterium]
MPAEVGGGAETCLSVTTRGVGRRVRCAWASVAASRERKRLPKLPAAIPQSDGHGFETDAGAMLGRRTRFESGLAAVGCDSGCRALCG